MRKKIIGGSVAVLLAILWLWPAPTLVLEENPLRATGERGVLVIAHGGGNLEFPDNTLEAYYHAFSIDPQVMMEADVSITADGVIILSHDTTLDQKTMLLEANIHETSYAFLVDEAIDFGYQNDVFPSSNGFNVSGIHRKYTDYQGRPRTPLDVVYPEGVEARHPQKFLVTTLEDLIKAFPDNLLNIEIKQQDAIGQDALAGVLTLMADLDAEYNTFARIVLASFHQDIYEAMVEAKATYPQLMISPQQDGVLRFFVTQLLGFNLFFNEPVHAFQLPLSQFNIPLQSRRLIRTAHRHNVAVHYWTIDDPEVMRDLIERGADGIMTNRPTLLREVIDSMAND